MRLPRTVQAELLLSALIHLAPLSALVGAERLQALYGLGELDASLQLLLQHRATLFGLLGLGLLLVLRRPGWREPLIVLTLASDLAFLGFCLLHGPLNPALQRVALADAVSILALLAAAIALWRAQRSAAGT